MLSGAWMDWNYGGAGAVEVYGALENECRRRGVMYCEGAGGVEAFDAHRAGLHGEV